MGGWTDEADISQQIKAMSGYPEQAAAFAAFRRLPSDTDEALAENGSVLSFFARHPAAGAQPELSRVVNQDANVTLGIFPTTRVTQSGATEAGVCFVVATADGAVVAAPAPISEAKSQPLVVRYNNSTGEHMYGVVPDGVHSIIVTVESGHATEVPVSSDGGFVFTSEARIISWSYINADGVTQTHTTESPTSWATMNPQ